MMFDASVANAARIYDFLLGGKNNYAVDREAAKRMLSVLPHTADACRENRAFLQRSVRFLAGEAGIRQFLDIGTGLPTMGNVHEVAQEIARDSKVAYVDYDEIVLSHARALLATNPNVLVSEGDLKLPLGILADAIKFMDFGRPIAVLLVAILHFISDDERPYEAVEILADALPAGSYIVISHSTPDHVSDEIAAAMRSAYTDASAQVTPRSHAQILKFFAGLELIEPGLVSVTDWRPHISPSRQARPQEPSLVYGGVAIKRLQAGPYVAQCCGRRPTRAPHQRMARHAPRQGGQACRICGNG